MPGCRACRCSTTCAEDIPRSARAAFESKGIAGARWANQAAPTAGGQYNLVRIREETLRTFEATDGVLRGIAGPA